MIKKQDEPTLVGEETLKKHVFFNDSVVRPIKPKEGVPNNNILTGIILKLPLNKQDECFFPGDEWKSLIPNENRLNVGDIVLYNSKHNITLDGEVLHLVCHFIGKILK